MTLAEMSQRCLLLVLLPSLCVCAYVCLLLKCALRSHLMSGFYPGQAERCFQHFRVRVRVEGDVYQRNRVKVSSSAAISA